MEKKILGVLGGMGPMASARFYTLTTEFTDARDDAGHIKTVLLSFPDIADRTAFILDQSRKSPVSDMQKAIHSLENEGAQIIAIPCNTADYFYWEMQKNTHARILRSPWESALFAYEKGVHKAGVMATVGCIRAEVYARALSAFGIECVTPTQDRQEELHSLIYSRLKRSLTADKDVFYNIANELFLRGCDTVILGCTELALIPRDENDKKFYFIDSLSVLARAAVLACGYGLSEKGKLCT